MERAEVMPEDPGPSSQQLTNDMRLRICEMEDWGEEDMEDIDAEKDQLVTYPESDGSSEISPTAESSSDFYDNVRITEVDDESMEVD
jgi:hypothetical protein